MIPHGSSLKHYFLCFTALTNRMRNIRMYLCIKGIWTFLAKAQMVRIKVHSQGQDSIYEYREANK